MADMASSRAGQDGVVATGEGPRASRPRRRTFTADYKMRILAQNEQLDDPRERGALLRTAWLLSVGVVSPATSPVRDGLVGDRLARAMPCREPTGAIRLYVPTDVCRVAEGEGAPLNPHRELSQHPRADPLSTCPDRLFLRGRAMEVHVAERFDATHRDIK